LRKILLAATVLSIPFVAAAQRTPAVDPAIQKAIEESLFQGARDWERGSVERHVRR
jgi:hypothetical protein